MNAGTNFKLLKFYITKESCAFILYQTIYLQFFLIFPDNAFEFLFLFGDFGF